MEALVPAFIAALLIQLGDRSPWLVAILADRYGRPLTVALAALIAHAAGNAIAGIGGLLMAPILTPNAKQLLLALALIFAGAGALWRVKPPDRRWRSGTWPTALFRIFLLALGDATQFVTLALSARSGLLAIVGATLGAFAISLFAAMLGEKAWRRLPLRPVRIAIGVVALVIGAILAFGALRLI